MMARSDSLLTNEGRPVAQSEFRPWLGQRYFPEHSGRRTSPTEFFVIDLITQHDVEPDGQLARHGHLGGSSSSTKGQAAVGAPQSRIEPAGGLRGLDQQKAQQTIALLGEPAKVLSPAAGFFLRNQSHIAGDVLGVREALHRSQDQHRAQRRQRPHAGMSQQALGVGPLRHFLREAFVQFRNPAIQLRA